MNDLIETEKVGNFPPLTPCLHSPDRTATVGRYRNSKAEVRRMNEFWNSRTVQYITILVSVAPLLAALRVRRGSGERLP